MSRTTADSTGRDKEALLVELLARKGFSVAASTGPGRRPSREPMPAGPAQRRFWIQERVEGVPGLNNLGGLVRFDEPVDRAALERAVAAVTARHEALRSRFAEAGGGVVEVVEASATVPLERLVGARTDGGALAAFVERPFVLEEAPLWRLALFAAPADAAFMLLACHHAILDWTGAERLVDELMVVYEAARAGRAPDLPPVPLQQADFGHWLRGDARRARAARDRDYWRERLAGQAPSYEPVAANPRARFEGKRVHPVPIALEPAMTAALRRFAAERRSTPFMVLLAAYAATLGRFAMAEEVSIGTSVTNRDDPGTDAIVGCLTDMAVLRCDLAGEPGFGALAQRIHAACAKDFEHTGLGFAELVELVKPERRAGAAPLFQVIFNLLPMSGGAGEAPRLAPIQPRLARADLALELRDRGGRIDGVLEYRDGLIAPAVAESMAEALICLLRQGIAAPDRAVDRLPLTGAAAVHGEPAPAPTESLAELFVARAESRPDAVAVIEGERRATYGELLARATALAERLVDLGVAPGQPVAACLERSVDLAVAMLGVLRAGGVILPLDPAYPDARLAELLGDSGAAVLIAQARPDWLPGDTACAVVDPDAGMPRGIALPDRGPDGAAYLVYTSGSTGRPKGAIGVHGGSINRLRWMWRAVPFEAGEVSCQKTSSAFADFVWEFFGPLLAGVPSVVADTATARDPRALTDLIRIHGVSRIVLVPSLLRAWLDTLPDLAERLASLRICVSSGEALPAELARRFRAAVPGCRLLNLYGSSEVSSDVTWYEVAGDEGERIPVGHPIPGNRMAVVDGAGHALPPGVPGEIVVAGIGLALGYLGDPEATAARFGPYGPETEAARWFRTGDIGCWDGEGRLLYLGRRDRQVKVGGVRVEPGEVEAALARYPGVRESQVLARVGEAAGSTGLVAYLAGDADLSADALRAFLLRRLPRAIVPESFVILDRLPLNANGKFDVARLPAPPPAEAAGRRAALDPLEALVAEVWASALDRPVESAEADFFGLGGSSLQAIVAMARLGEALGRDLPVAMLFETPNLAALAQHLTDEAEEGGGLPPPRAESADGPAPATGNQTWLWDEYRAEPNRIAYNVPVAYRLDGSLDRAALEAAVAELFRRHEALRTRLEMAEGGLVQIVDPPPDGPLAFRDLSAEADPEAALGALVEEYARRPFALDRDLPWRIELVRLGADSHGLVMVMHHVASDGWSGQILVAELAALYGAQHEGVKPPPPPSLQCGDVARWQRASRPALLRRLDGYRQALAGSEAPRPAGLAADGDSGGPVAVAPVALDPALLERFLRHGDWGRVTPFIAMLAAWATLLARFGDCERPMLATPFAGRGAPALQSVVGFLANPVLLSVDLSDSPSFSQAVAAARNALLAALRHQDVPLAWIQASGSGWQGGEGGPALRAMLIVEDARAWDIALAGVTTRLAFAPRSLEARVDLALVVSQRRDGMAVELEYAERRVPRALAERLAQGLAALIAGAVADPSRPVDRLPLLGPGERPSVAVAAAVPEPAADRLDALLAHQAEARPDMAAASDGERALSYAALRARAWAVAARLQALGVGPGARVALVAAPSPRQVAGLLGIFRAGATAVPLDPAYPRSRIAETLADAAVVAALSDAPLDYPCPQLRLDEPMAGEPGPVEGGGEAPAAVIYTSGTTGKAKGVLVGQAALCRVGAALAETYGLDAGDKVLQVVSPAFDVSLSDLAMSLSAGACLVAPPRAAAVMPGRALAASLRTHAVTHLQAPAAILAVTDPGDLPALRAVAVGGEVCPPETARRWAEGRRLFIAYGPTETTVTAALGAYDGTAAPSTIGRAFCGARLAVLDPAGEPVPVGVPGELVIAGPNVAQGYLGRAEATAERFLADPEGAPGAPLPHRRPGAAGGGWQPDLPGPAGPPGEAARLPRRARRDGGGAGGPARGGPRPGRGARRRPGRAPAVRLGRAGDRRVPRRGGLARRLAAPLAGPPGAVRRDGHRDSAPDRQRQGGLGGAGDPGRGSVRPRARSFGAGFNPGEAAIRRDLGAHWAVLLDRPEIGLDESFFDIGGHSLLVVRMQEHVAERYGVELPVGELFAHPTLRSLAACVHDALAGTRAAEPAGAMEEFTL